MTNSKLPIIEVLTDRFAEAGEAEALVFRGQVRRFSEIIANLESVHKLLLGHNITKGDTVVLKADYCFNSVIFLLALVKIEATIVPVLPSSFENLKESIIKTGPAFLISVTPHDEVKIEKWAFPSKQDSLIKALKKKCTAGLVLFTSGSSGRPKGVVHDFGLLMEKFRERRPAFRTLNFLVFDHWGGLNTLLYGLSNCSVVVLPEQRTADYVCDLIEKYQIELLPSTPSFLNILLASQSWKTRDLSSLKIISYGAEPMPEPTLRRLKEVFQHVELRQTYGLIELGVLRAKSKNDSSLWVKLGGKGYDLRVVDNMLQIKAESAMLGYIDAPSPFTEDGYFITGDKVQVDGEYLRILGRDSDLINVGGEKVYPLEVESVLLSCDNIKDGFVYGEKHPMLGNIVCADVLLKEPEPLAQLRVRLKKACSASLDSFKVPVKISIVSENIYSDRMKKIRTKW